MLRFLGKSRPIGGGLPLKRANIPTLSFSNSVSKETGKLSSSLESASVDTKVAKQTSVAAKNSNKFSFGGVSLRDSLKRVEEGLVKPTVKVMPNLSESTKNKTPSEGKTAQKQTSKPAADTNPVQSKFSVNNSSSSTASADSNKSVSNAKSSSTASSKAAAATPTAKSISQDILSALAAPKPVSFSQAISKSTSSLNFNPNTSAAARTIPGRESLFNHLEQVEPVTEGEVRFKQQQQKLEMKRKKMEKELGMDFGSNRSKNSNNNESAIKGKGTDKDSDSVKQMKSPKDSTKVTMKDSLKEKPVTPQGTELSAKKLSPNASEPASVDADVSNSKFSIKKPSSSFSISDQTKPRSLSGANNDSFAAALEQVKANKPSGSSKFTSMIEDSSDMGKKSFGDFHYRNNNYNHQNNNNNNNSNNHYSNNGSNKNGNHANRRNSNSSNNYQRGVSEEERQKQLNERLLDSSYRLRRNRESIERLLEDHESQNNNHNSNQSNAGHTVVKKLVVPVDGLSARQIAQKTSLKLTEIRAKLEEMGEWPQDSNEDTSLDADVVEILALDLGFTVNRIHATEEEAAGLYDVSIRAKSTFRERQSQQNAKLEASGQVLQIRPPTVCIVGHVDHGKTTLLDALRSKHFLTFNKDAAANASDKNNGKQADKKAAKNAAKSGNGGKVESLADAEAGGITQRLSAFTVDFTLPQDTAETDDGDTKQKAATREAKVVFLDTPGHAAFSSMRHKGAAATDIAVLVIALDEGVMPQTVDAIQAVSQAGCAVVVALNKIDRVPVSQRPAMRSKIVASLANLDILAEEIGGEVQVVEVAAKTGEGVAELLQAITVQADVMDLKCVSQAPAEAMVLDAKVEKGRGIVADVIVRAGSLRLGDAVVVGSVSGKVKALYDDKNKAIQLALPSQPVRLLGLKDLPLSGAELLVVENENKAKLIADRRLRISTLRQQQQQQQLTMRHVIAASATGEAGATPHSAGDTATATAGDTSATPGGDTPVPKQKMSLGVVLKADSLGALEALQRIVQEVASVCADSVVLRVASQGVGSVTQSDVDILGANNSHQHNNNNKDNNNGKDNNNNMPNSETLILAFNVAVADNATKLRAKQLDMEIVRDDVIYRLEDALKTYIEDLLPSERVETREGQAKVLKIFKLKDKKNTVVAGSAITHGRVTTLNHLIREENKKSSGNVAKSDKDTAGVSSAPKVNGFYRVIRNGTVIHEHPMSKMELKRFKDSVSEVSAGVECGLSFDGYADVEEGDEIECYKVSLKKRSLSPTYDPNRK